MDEKVDEDEGKTAEEIEKELKQREMEEQAQILEMVREQCFVLDKLYFMLAIYARPMMHHLIMFCLYAS